jgi:hypothetical protein
MVRQACVTESRLYMPETRDHPFAPLCSALLRIAPRERALSFAEPRLELSIGDKEEWPLGKKHAAFVPFGAQCLQAFAVNEAWPWPVSECLCR